MNTNIVIQIEPFQNFQCLKDSRDIKLAKNFDKLSEYKLNLEENSIISYIEKSEFFRNLIKKELNFDSRKYTEFIQVSIEILDFENLKVQLKDIKESLK